MKDRGVRKSWLRVGLTNLEREVEEFLGQFQPKHDWTDSLGYLLVRHRQLGWMAESKRDLRLRNRVDESFRKVEAFSALQRGKYAERVLFELEHDAESLGWTSMDVVKAAGYDEWDNDLDIRTSAEELLREAHRLGIDVANQEEKIRAFDEAMRKHASDLEGTIPDYQVIGVPLDYWWWHICERTLAPDGMRQARG